MLQRKVLCFNYVTLSIKIRREHARKTEIHNYDDDDDENKQTEDDGKEILQ